MSDAQTIQTMDDSRNSIDAEKRLAPASKYSAIPSAKSRNSIDAEKRLAPGDGGFLLGWETRRNSIDAEKRLALSGEQLNAIGEAM